MSLTNYKAVEESGVLTPRTPIIPPILNKFFLLRENTKTLYLFCLKDTPEPKDWVESGWLEEVKKKQGKDGYALLSFETEEVTVLNGSCMYDAVDEIKASVKDEVSNIRSFGRFIVHGPKVRRAFREYLDSKCTLKEYDGSYRLAEFLVSKEIPAEFLNLEDLIERTGG